MLTFNNVFSALIYRRQYKQLLELKADGQLAVTSEARLAVTSEAPYWCGTVGTWVTRKGSMGTDRGVLRDFLLAV